MSGFSIYSRKRKNGKPVYYIQFKNSDGTYTTYTVVVNRFVRFDTNDKEQDDPSGNILKVTLQNENGETLTSLFLSD